MLIKQKEKNVENFSNILIIATNNCNEICKPKTYSLYKITLLKRNLIRDYYFFNIFNIFINI
jgi:hypothetical protein